MNMQPSPKQFDENRWAAEGGHETSTLGSRQHDHADESSDFESIFQARTATGAWLNSWISPLLNQIIKMYHPESQLFGFIHWINQNPRCPWIILSGSLEYGRKAPSSHQEAAPEVAIPIRWSVGRYQTSSRISHVEMGYMSQLSIAVVFDSGHVPVELQCNHTAYSSTKCSLTPHALSRTLETLYR